MKGRETISLTVAILWRSQRKEGEQKLGALAAQKAQQVILAAEQIAGKVKNSSAGVGSQQEDV